MPCCPGWRSLARRGLLRDADASNEAPSYSAGEALTLGGYSEARSRRPRRVASPRSPSFRVRRLARGMPWCTRFNLHASVHLAAHDDLGRERLCRYLARPAFSLARFGVRTDRPCRLPGEESRSRPGQAAGDDRARVPWSPRGHGASYAVPASSPARRAWSAPSMASAGAASAP